MKWLMTCSRCKHSWQFETQEIFTGNPPPGTIRCANCGDNSVWHKKWQLLTHLDPNTSPGAYPSQNAGIRMSPPSRGGLLGIPPNIYLFWFIICFVFSLIIINSVWSSGEALGFAFGLFGLSLGLLGLMLFIFEVGKKQITWQPFAIFGAVAVLTIIFLPIYITYSGRPAKKIIMVVAQLCQETGVLQEAEYYTPSPGIHPTVLLNWEGNPVFWTGRLPSKWRPSSIDEVELVLCMGEERVSKIETCSYQTGPAVVRWIRERVVTLIDAQTREIIYSGIVTGDLPRPCYQLEDYDRVKISGKPIASSDIVEWLRPYVEGQVFP